MKGIHAEQLLYMLHAATKLKLYLVIVFPRKNDCNQQSGKPLQHQNTNFLFIPSVYLNKKNN